MGMGHILKQRIQKHKQKFLTTKKEILTWLKHEVDPKYKKRKIKLLIRNIFTNLMCLAENG